ncbi:hypothetical protein TK45_02925 [Bowmanella sp. JS7-9]|nr:hypothetical protein TK45_02925 [Bowmanella sp. JS7-9]
MKEHPASNCLSRQIITLQWQVARFIRLALRFQEDSLNSGLIAQLTAKTVQLTSNALCSNAVTDKTSAFTISV